MNEPETALVTAATGDAGVFAIGSMAQGDFDQRLAALRSGLARLDKIVTSVLQPGIDFMEIRRENGTAKSLLLPGAEKLAYLLRLSPSFTVIRTLGDGITGPPIHYLVTARLHLGGQEGPVVSEGVGSCNSWERKYRYRVAELVCPECGVVGDIRKSKFSPKGSPEGTPPGWYCKACSAQFHKDAPEIQGQQRGSVDMPDPFDLDNTLVKMGKKRAFIDGIKTATAGSGHLTQDLEDMHPERAAGEPAIGPGDAPAGIRGPDPATRRDLEMQLMAGAKSRKLTKLGQVFAEVATHGSGTPRIITDIKEVTDDEIRATLSAWSKPE